VDPVPDPLLLRKSGSARNRTWTSGSVAESLISGPQRRSVSQLFILVVRKYTSNTSRVR
jgi:hypothetical protein